MHVDILKMGDDGVEQRLGSLIYDGWTLRAEPADSVTLQSIIGGQWPTDIDGEPVMLTKDEPELLLQHLHRILRSAYLKATEPLETP